LLIKEEGVYLFGGQLGSGKLLRGVYVLKPYFTSSMLKAEWKVLNTIGKVPAPRIHHTFNYMA
jgi:hypothetical protein